MTELDEVTVKSNTYALEVLCKDNLDEESSLLSDPFHVHFEKNIGEKLVEQVRQALSDRSKLLENEQRLNWHSLGDLVYVAPLNETKVILEESKSLKSHALKQRILERLNEAIESLLGKPEPDAIQMSEYHLDKFQSETLNIISTYVDFYNPNVEVQMDAKNKFAYAIHALNHVLKTRSRIIAHNDKIKQSKSSVEIEYRDQGLTRPKVPIMFILDFSLFSREHFDK